MRACYDGSSICLPSHFIEHSAVCVKGLAGEGEQGLAERLVPGGVRLDQGGDVLGRRPVPATNVTDRDATSPCRPE
jgi:hypothetical protein